MNPFQTLKRLLTIAVLALALHSTRAQIALTSADLLTWQNTNSWAVTDSFIIYASPVGGTSNLVWRAITRTNFVDAAVLLTNAPSGTYTISGATKSVTGLQSEYSTTNVVWTAPLAAPIKPPHGWSKKPK